MVAAAAPSQCTHMDDKGYDTCQLTITGENEEGYQEVAWECINCREFITEEDEERLCLQPAGEAWHDAEQASNDAHAYYNSTRGV